MRLFGEFPKKVASSRAESRTDSAPSRNALHTLPQRVEASRQAGEQDAPIQVSVVPGEIGGVEIPHTVSGRELWERLGIKKHYTQWMEVQLGEMFSQDVDFEAFNLKVISGNKPEKNHRLTLKMAKKIAMAEHTDEGNAVRDYFLDRERISYEAPRRATALNDVDIASIVSDVVACIPRVPRTFKNPVTQTPTVAVSSRLRR